MTAVDRRTVLVANPGADLFGSDRMVLETVRGLVASGREVVVALPADGPLVGKLREAGAEVIHQPTPVLRKGLMSPRGLVTLLSQTLAAVPGTWRVLRSTRAGTVVVNTITMPLWLVLARLRPGVRVVCHVHEAEQAVPRAVRRLLYLPLHAAHRVIANSRHSLAVLADSAPVLPRRTVVVHNTVPGPDEVVRPRPELGPPVRLLYVGRLSERKGLIPAVEALAQLRDRGTAAVLRVVGSVFPGNEAFVDDLRGRIDALGLAGMVDIAGFRSDVWPELAATDIVLVPSLLDESFGNVAVEAALAARPAVVSDLAGLREATAASASVRLVPPGDARAIADAVLDLVGAWPAEAALAEQGASRAAAEFSAGRYTAELLTALGR